MMGRQTCSPVLAVAALGIAGQVAQIVLLREYLMVFHGSELAVGIVLAAWMFWTATGSRLAGIPVARLARPRRAAAAIGLLLPPVFLLQTLGIRSVRAVLGALPGTMPGLRHMGLVSLTLTAPAGLLLGMYFVVLARLWRERDGVTDTSAAGKAYLCEAAGNVIGGVLFTLVLVHATGSLTSLWLTGLLPAAALPWLFPWRTGRRLAATAAVVLTGFALRGAVDGVDRLALLRQWQAATPEHRLEETRRSKYGKLAVARREDQVSFFQSGHLVFSAAAPEADSPWLEDLEGVRLAHAALAQHPDPRRILLIGGGLRGILRGMTLHPVERIDYLELDPALTDIARRHVHPDSLRALDDPRVRLHHGDGRLFVRGARERYDLILVDAPDPLTAALNRFYTREFFLEAAVRLLPDGMLVIGAVSTPDVRGTAAANRNATLFHTLGSVFPQVLAVGDRFLLFFATAGKDRLTEDPAVLERRFRERDIESPGFSPLQFHLLFEPGQLRRVNQTLRRHGRISPPDGEPPPPAALFPPPVAEQARGDAALPPVATRRFINADLRPVGYYHSLVFWHAMTDGREAGLTGAIIRVRTAWLAALVPLGLLPSLGWLLAARLACDPARRVARGRAAQRHAVRFAVFTTGLSTMMLQVALLFLFQSVYGVIYEWLGLIVALFMAGLLTGTALAQARIARKADVRALALVQLAIAAFAGLLIPGLPRIAALTAPAAVAAGFALVTFASGLLNGIDFPLATACRHALGMGPDRATGSIYGLELAGGCCGALLAGVVVAPVLGIVICCLLASLANAAAGVILLVARFGYRDEFSLQTA